MRNLTCGKGFGKGEEGFGQAGIWRFDVIFFRRNNGQHSKQKIFNVVGEDV